MKIAIIENNIDYIQLLKERIKKYNWNIDYFKGSVDFGKTDLKKYDVIIAGHFLYNSSNGIDILKGIQSKTSAELFLMSTDYRSISEKEINNDKINGFIDKINIQNIIDALKYCDVKIKINKIMQSEKSKFEYILSNGFNIELYKDCYVIKIKDTLSKISEKKILDTVINDNIKNVIISYPQTDILKNLDLETIVSLFISFKNNDIKMALWNINEKSKISDQLKECKMTLLFKIFDNLEECVFYLKSGTTICV
jgi:anti-anti-sigma regulatory factor